MINCIVDWPECFWPFVMSAPFSWHLGGSGVVCLLVFLALSTRLKSWSLNGRVLLSGGVSFVFGVIYELLQGLSVLNGYCDVNDIVVDLVGVLLGAGLALWAGKVLREG